MAPKSNTAARTVLSIATKRDMAASEVYVVRPSGAEDWKNMPRLLWMKVDSRSWSAGTRKATRSCGFEKTLDDAPQSWGDLSPSLLPRGFLKNQFRRAVSVLLEGDGELRRSW